VERFHGLKRCWKQPKENPQKQGPLINKQGFTEENYEKFEKAERRKKLKNCHQNKKELLEQYKELKKIRDTAISILRRHIDSMPLLNLWCRSFKTKSKKNIHR